MTGAAALNEDQKSHFWLCILLLTCPDLDDGDRLHAQSSEYFFLTKYKWIKMTVDMHKYNEFKWGQNKSYTNRNCSRSAPEVGHTNKQVVCGSAL